MSFDTLPIEMQEVKQEVKSLKEHIQRLTELLSMQNGKLLSISEISAITGKCRDTVSADFDRGIYPKRGKGKFNKKCLYSDVVKVDIK